MIDNMLDMLNIRFECLRHDYNDILIDIDDENDYMVDIINFSFCLFVLKCNYIIS